MNKKIGMILFSGFFWVVALFFLGQAIRAIPKDPNYLFFSPGFVLIAVVVTVINYRKNASQ